VSRYVIQGPRYTLADVTTIELKKVGDERDPHSFFMVTNVMSDGTRHTAPAVNTVTQAEQRQCEWFPNAVVKEV
jgi:hypothetical protein